MRGENPCCRKTPLICLIRSLRVALWEAGGRQTRRYELQVRLPRKRLRLEARVLWNTVVNAGAFFLMREQISPPFTGVVGGWRRLLIKTDSQRFL